MAKRRAGGKPLPPTFIELEGFKELARLSCALEKFPLPILGIKTDDGEHLLATQLDYIKGRSIFYYARSPSIGRFLAYRLAGGQEEAFNAEEAFNPSYLFAPIIAVKRLPPLFERGLKDRPTAKGSVLSFELEDLASLARVCSQRILYEEPPLPVLSFPYEEDWILGAFAKINEYEDTSLFFYVRWEEAPGSNFIKYSAQRGDQASLSNRVEEHGYIFIKLVRLKEKHPLVEL